MGFGYKFFKNYMLPVSAVVFVVTLLALVVSLVGASVLPGVHASYKSVVRDYDVWILVIASFTALVSGWYFVEQLYLRRKFNRVLDTDRKSDVMATRKEAEEVARRLPDSYKKRIEAFDVTTAGPRSKRAR